MCGLVGIAGDTTGSWKDVYTQLLLIDCLRGMHSTGAAFVGRYDEKFTLAKRVGHPFNLFHSKEFDDMMDPKVSSKVILGHNRHATFGEKTEDNAHPFAFEHVVGMHNGTLDEPSVKDLHNSENYGTDSEAVYSTINMVGIEETMKLMSGAWALVWYDKRDHRLNMLRNDKRPLHYCYSRDRCTMIWASEEEMLRYVMQRNKKEIEEDKIYVLPKDMHYSWKIPESINKKFDAPDQRPQEGRQWVWQGPFKGGSNTHHTSAKKTGGTTTQTHSHSKSKHANDTIAPFAMRFNTDKFRPPYKDQYQKVISKKLFEPMVNEGCAFCNTNGQKWGEFIHIMGHYSGYHTPYLCEDCFNSEDIYEFAQYAI